MKRRLLIPGACVLALLPVAGWPAPVEQVSLTLGTLHSTIQSAIDAVDDGGTVEIIESGEYVGPVRIPGGKTFTVRATAPDVVSTNAGESWTVPGPTSPGYVPGPVKVTLESFILRRTAGSGAALDVETRESGINVELVFNSMTVEHTVVDGGGEAVLVIDRSGMVPPQGSAFLSGWFSRFTTLQTTGSPKSALRVASDGSAGVGTAASYWSFCHFSNNADAPALSLLPVSSQYLHLVGTEVQSPGTGIEAGSLPNFVLFIVVGSRINAGRRCISLACLGLGTQLVSYSTLDNSSSTTGEPAVVIDQQIVYIPVPFSPPVALSFPAELVNNRITCGDVAGGLPCVVMEDDASIIRHNTFVAAGAANPPAIKLNAATIPPTISNNIFLGFESPDFLSGPDGWRHNLVVGPIDDPTRGANSAYVYAAPGLANAVAAANLDPSTLMPLPGSPALGAGEPTQPPYDSGDREAQPYGTNPDVGWLENTTLPLPHGDVTNDGVLDLSDLTELGNYLAGHVAMPAGDVDVDNNGVVNQLDIDYLADFFVGNGPNPQP